MNITTKQILKQIANKNLELVRGSGYWYFVYDDYKLDIHTLTYSGRYQTRSVMCQNLKYMTLEQWVEEGKDFVEEVEAMYN